MQDSWQGLHSLSVLSTKKPFSKSHFIQIFPRSFLLFNPSLHSLHSVSKGPLHVLQTLLQSKQEFVILSTYLPLFKSQIEQYPPTPVTYTPVKLDPKGQERQ